MYLHLSAIDYFALLLYGLFQKI